FHQDCPPFSRCSAACCLANKRASSRRRAASGSCGGALACTPLCCLRSSWTARIPPLERMSSRSSVPLTVDTSVLDSISRRSSSRSNSFLVLISLDLQPCRQLLQAPAYNTSVQRDGGRSWSSRARDEKRRMSAPHKICGRLRLELQPAILFRPGRLAHTR